MPITIRFFATLKDRAGLAETSLELEWPATVKTLLDHLMIQFPALENALPSALVSVNHEYAFPEDIINDNDEVALFPPVSGGSHSSNYFAITAEELDINLIIDAITSPETGGICIFTGAVRGITHKPGSPEQTSYLLYEAYEPMAEKKLQQIADEIREMFPKVQGVALVQRIGKLAIGDTTTLIACSAGHRDDDIFAAARYGIDRLKEIVPVWKKEVGADGELWVEGHYHPTPDNIHVTETQPTFSQFACTSCDETYPIDTKRYRCTCGKPLDLADPPTFRQQNIEQSDYSLWRYKKMLIPEGITPVTLGEGWTPLIDLQTDKHNLKIKLESLNPSGSFKDRGATVLTTMLKAQEATQVHDDSSGNAGAALSAYSAKAGLDATLFVPSYASQAKLNQIALYGATLKPIEGPRSEASRASVEAAEGGQSIYASHIYHPFAMMGFKTGAYELWEQLGYHVPDVVIAPMGHGSQILGLAEGFDDLLQAGLIEKLPQLIGVQPETCAPIWHRFHEKDSASEEGETLAEGIRILTPVRIDDLISGIKKSNGDIITVSEESIHQGLVTLARRGINAEPTSSVVWPAYQQVANRFSPEAIIVLSITGSGFKTPDVGRFIG